MGRVDGKVALVTGAARGQGRAHAVRLAEEGADIIAFDLCKSIPGVQYELSTEDDLAKTVEMIESLDRRVHSQVGDVRSREDVQKLVADGLQELGKIDVLVCNAGIFMPKPVWEINDEEWDTQIGVNLTGVWRVVSGVIPSLIEAGNGGSIVITTSGSVNRNFGNMTSYVAAKTGLEGFARELAADLSPHWIRVNTIAPTTVETRMADNPWVHSLFTPDKEGAPAEERRKGMMDAMSELNMLNVPWVQPEDVANGVLFLASDESRMVTGASLRVDAGFGSH